jgi:hypothetical protein
MTDKGSDIIGAWPGELRFQPAAGAADRDERLLSDEQLRQAAEEGRRQG